ncbi:cupin domain-containing protein [Chitinophaga lutea]|nr:hypothetical protein [Chitinophaga lutea]
MNTHPSDIEIQDYALQPPGATHAHIDHCPHCMQRVRQYRLMLTALNRQAIPEPAFHVTDAVMARLPKRPSATKNALRLTMAGAAIIAAASIPFLPYISGFYSWLSLVERNTMSLLALGSIALAAFLLALQLLHFRKMIGAIKNNEALQPDH